ncbi:GerAB/ArcD/ProY family transporter [Neobacillus massiliamazoniensis]|uniref:Spore germination protein n=1 Tax=Neobacillus massiliamazoniensis TaxID=1499688 RepID=A0A0U1NZ56_9BACI|nr:endospore germination permease [Neobacillus massiliamazoniensis]CRK83277.1 spore germination protein [Neobacillus massiliamazoniensis]
MIEKGKISPFQMALIMYVTVVATAILYIPFVNAQQANRDLWLSPIWGSLSGFLIVFIMIKLYKIYPKKTLIQYSEIILGRALGKIIGFIYLFFLLHDTAIAFREYSEFIESSFLFKTPMVVIIGSIALICAYAVHGGLEVVGRCALVFLPIVLFFYVMIYFLLIPDLNVNNMFPIMEDGLIPSIKGSIAPHAWLSQYSLMSFLIPFLTDETKGMKWGIASVFASVITMVFMNLGNLFLFGQSITNIPFPVFVAAKYISVGKFFEHVESIVISVWVLGGFVQLSAFYYMLVLGTSQWLKLSSYKPIVLPIGYLIILFSIWSTSSLQEMLQSMGTTTPFYFLTIQLLIPILLICMAIIKKQGHLGKNHMHKLKPKD